MFLRKSRKGQFFIVGAVMIVLLLHMLSNTLMSGTDIDYSLVQDNNPIWTFDETEKALYQITEANLSDSGNIDEFIEVQKGLARESGYALDFDIVFKPYYANNFSVYTMSLKSKRFYILKEDRLLPYYSLCDAGAVCVPANAGFSEVCCKAYGLCC